MKNILLITLLLCAQLCVCAVDWQRCGSVYVDNHTIKKSENSVQAWVIHPDFEKSKPVYKNYLYEAALFDAKCSSKEMALLNTAWYDKYHQLVYHPAGEITYIKIRPKTNNEIIFKALCNQGKVL